ncbi:MAG TPA: NADP-dependent oxidoreductase [Candidatus Acidoferrales bacterium]|jgi:NADPH:quinone reductase-like Zn-dependent oxidoreductase|nr:NADP-dependent oxidoreductase [Candidatus Acidoferrales bacterium]
MQTISVATMKAVRAHGYGDAGMLSFEDAPLPSPGEGEVLVRVHAASVNPADWKLRAIIPGRDVSGVVEAVGPGVTRFAHGDAVFGNADGAYAQYAVANEAALARKPLTVDHIHAAAIPLAALTAWQALFEIAGLKEGRRLLIHGAAGGVGSFAVQLAKWKGARVAGTASSRNQLFLMSLGVDQAIDHFGQRFEDLVGPVDVVLDTVGGDAQRRSWNVLRKGGMLVSTVALPSAEEARRREATAAIFTSRPDGAQLAQIGELIDFGYVRPVVETVLPLSHAKRAHQISEAGHARGKIVLSVE